MKRYRKGTDVTTKDGIVKVLTTGHLPSKRYLTEVTQIGELEREGFGRIIERQDSYGIRAARKTHRRLCQVYDIGGRKFVFDPMVRNYRPRAATA